MDSIYVFEGKSDAGYQKTINEDYIEALILDKETLLLVIADGAKSDSIRLQPASIAVTEISRTVRRFFECNPEILFQFPDLILREAMENANRVLSVFTACDAERFSGFLSSATCCLLYKHENRICASVIGAGNTRLYLIRMTKGVPAIHQLTTDHTKAADMVLSGLLSEEEYYTHLDRLVLTSGLGVIPEPKYQILEDLSIKKDDIILLTTDGIHYAIRPQAICDIILQSGSCTEAVKSLIEASKLEKYPDNASAIIAYVP